LPKVPIEDQCERDELVLRLFLAGDTYRQIGRQVGLSSRQVRRVDSRELARAACIVTS
jgi:hypothetical protein